MKRILFVFILFFTYSFIDAQSFKDSNSVSMLKFSDLSLAEKKEAIQAMISGDCTYKGIALYGKVKFVNSFPDIKIQYVESFPDIKVKFVDSFPDKCGLWQVVNSFPDIKVQVVSSFPDIKVQVVKSFPGVE